MLSDRGEIAEGLRGDVVVIDPATRQPVATFVEGRLAWIAASGAQRIR
jgi:alpha-D-ribose 1-methylphosphonate 5-triphosphate diphosphatase